jgi:hypothetical protein
MSRFSWSLSEKKGFVLDTLTNLLVSREGAYTASASFAFLQPYNELLHVSEEGRLEGRRNACKAQCHYPKSPSVIKRIALTYIE